jgi:hypothetical protein
MDARVAAGGTLIRRYALALTPAGADIEAAVTAASAPLSGGPGNHGSETAHAFTIADNVGGTGSQPAEGPIPTGATSNPSHASCNARPKAQADAWETEFRRKHHMFDPPPRPGEVIESGDLCHHS